MKTTLAAILATMIALPSVAPAFASAVGTTIGLPSADHEIDRSKRRIKGGSGCDDPRDRIEHPECR